ncbi:MAG: hypothetical protein IPM42_17555 [Saprospiraceae bacterium]|nr:hypothetical protein [Saprospiraceae bacterium]
MTTFEIRLRENDQKVITLTDLRYSITVLRNSSTNEVIEAYFEILPSGRKFDGLTFKLIINGVERRFLEDI